MRESERQMEEKLLSQNPAERLTALRALCEMERTGELLPTEKTTLTNNHIHTIYSFSPYSPAAAVWRARRAGLLTAGIMDHDSIAGAREFRAAGHIADMPVTCGVECRVSFAGTFAEHLHVNNPDQEGVVYMSLHGVPACSFDEVQSFFAPRVLLRNERGRGMTEKASALLAPNGISIDFDKDVLPLSQFASGGSVTERHISLAVTRALISVFGRGSNLVDAWRTKLGLRMSRKLVAYLSDADNIHYEYDLIGAIKSEMLPSFFIPATEECPNVADFVALGRRTGSIVTYPYLGDVGDSVTGDKRTQKFEDDFLDELFDLIVSLGVQAVAYMPARNTTTQLDRVQKACVARGLLQVSGEDINTSRQKFTCEALNDPKHAHLTTAAFALVGHEMACDHGIEHGMFSEKTIAETPSLNARIAKFAQIGKEW